MALWPHWPFCLCSATVLAVCLIAVAKVQFYLCLLPAMGHSLLGACLYSPPGVLCTAPSTHLSDNPLTNILIWLCKLAIGDLSPCMVVAVQQHLVQFEGCHCLSGVVGLGGMSK